MAQARAFAGRSPSARLGISLSPDAKDAAVIDVGSNSVRLVVFRVDGRAMTPILNEKVMAGLGRGLNESGILNPRGREATLSALRRFASLVDALGVQETHAVATAAMRAADDGPEFAEQVRRDTGIALKVIDGPEESRLSALGVLAGAPDAQGVVGDLGGSSLELAPISPRGVGAGESYPLGPLALAGGEPVPAERIVETVDAHLARSAALAKGRAGAFYAVGGAWRALGRIDMTLRDHPLTVLHQHVMPRTDAMRVVDFVRKQSRRSIERFEEAAAKRADTLPYAALILQRILEIGQFDHIVLSSYGLREGLLFDAMSPDVRARDALVASAEAFGAPTHRGREFGAALARFVSAAMCALPPAFTASRDARLRAAACRLADIGAGLHPEQRGTLVFDLVLRAPLAAVTHAERAFLAASVHARYTKGQTDPQGVLTRLLTDDQRANANALGMAMRLGAEVSGRSPDLMERFQLKRQAGGLKLAARSQDSHLLTPSALRRLEPLAAALGLRVEPSKD